MKLKISAKSVFFYAAYAISLVFLNKAADGIPFSIGLLFSYLLCGASCIISPALYILASIVNLNLITSLLSIFEGVFLSLVTFIYRRTKRKIRIESAAYLIIALSPYIAFSKWTNEAALSLIGNEYAVKGIAAVAVMAFTFFCFKTVYALMYKLLRCKLKEDELVCCTVVYAAVGAGLYNLAGFFVYTAIAAGILAYAVRLSKSPFSLIAAMALAIPPSIITFSLTPLTFYTLSCAVVLIFSRTGRFPPCAVTLTLFAVYLYFTGGFNCSTVLIVFRSLLLLLTCALPAIPSDKSLGKLKDRLLVKETLQGAEVMRTRRRTGEKLYRISEVFREIECAFCALDENMNDEASRARMLEELKEKCCERCDKNKQCRRTDVYVGFKKLIDAGCVKGKVNLIDLPSEITLNCAEPAEVLDRLNILLVEYRRYITEAENAKSGRILLADQARGVAEVMKSCAVELCKTYNEYTDLAESIKNKLSSFGVSCPELYIAGEDMEVSLTVCGKPNIKVIIAVLTEAIGKKYQVTDKFMLDDAKYCLVFSTPPKFDAAFGAAYAIKDGERVSGDTHSVIKINGHSFLMALSDGMGSGEYAKKVSATAISLIEAFYRAEMPEGTVLKTINKLLSFNSDERFTCIDIAAVNLDTGKADFVKIGSPAGIIMRSGEIKVLESQSLPLGILENLKPTVCTEQLKSGDIVVFMSDGITSAFPSSTELYEFMQGLNPLNPQSLADKILAGARARSSSVADDMTVLCTRIFEK